MKAHGLLLFVIALPARAGLPVPELERLPNGLTVAWFVDDRLPLVDLALLVRAGKRADPAGGSGTAELLAAAIDKGAGSLDTTGFARAVERLGATRYVSADDDSMTLGVHGLSSDADPLIGLLADLALRPALPPEAVRWERERISQILEKVRTDTEGALSLAFARIMAAGTPYFRGSVLSAPELGRIGREDLVSFHARYFVPEGAVLMIAGKVDREAFSARVSEAFGSWRAPDDQGTAHPADPPRPPADSGEPSGRAAAVVHFGGEEQAHVRVGFRLPSIGSPDSWALMVVNAILGEYFKSRLNQVVRDGLGLTYSIRSSMTFSKDVGILTIGTSTRAPLVGKLLDKTYEVVDGLRKHPPSPGELRQAKDFLIGSFPVRTAGLVAAASRWLAGHVFGLGPEYLNHYAERVEKVTAADVARVATAYLDTAGARAAVAGDGDRIAQPLAKSGFRIFRRVSGGELLQVSAPPSGTNPGKKPRTRS